MSQFNSYRRMVDLGANRLALASLLSIGLTGCVTGSLGSRGTATTQLRAVQEMFVGPGLLQYYLVPQHLDGPAGQYARLDLVVRDSMQVPRYGLLHLSVVGPAAIEPATDTLLLGTSGPALAVPTSLLYAESKGKATLSRLEAHLTPAQLTAYLRSPAKSIYLGSAKGRRRFVPTEKAVRNLQAFGTQAVGPGTY